MPDERDIEKGLRAWATRRREDAGAPVKLHPATRRLLQAEAARLRGGCGRGSVARWLWGSPLRLVLNLSAVAALVIAAALLLPQLHHAPAPVAITAGREVLAENLRKEAENPSAGSPLNPVETEKDSRDTSKAKSNANAIYLGDRLEVAKKEAAPPSAMPGAAPSTAILDQGELANNSPPTETAAPTPTSAVASVAVETPPAPPAPAPVVQRLFWASSLTNTSAHYELTAKKSEVAQVLASFRTEQTGNRLRVIDADGSVYTGVLAAARGQVSNGTVSPVQSRSFRVSGTNVTSRQRVVFTGRLVLGAQPQPAASSTVVGGGVDVSGATAGAGGGGFGGAGSNYKNKTVAGDRQTNTSFIAGTALQSSAAQGALPVQPQFRIEGTVRIGTNQIPVNAVSAAR